MCTYTDLYTKEKLSVMCTYTDPYIARPAALSCNIWYNDYFKCIVVIQNQKLFIQ